MRISDWSSDVCSSDLNGLCPEGARAASIIGMMDEATKTRATYIGNSSGLVKGTCLSKSAESVLQGQRATRQPSRNIGGDTERAHTRNINANLTSPSSYTRCYVTTRRGYRWTTSRNPK